MTDKLPEPPPLTVKRVSVGRDLDSGLHIYKWPYSYEDDLICVFDSASVSLPDATASQQRHHHCTGSLLANAKLKKDDESPAAVMCGDGNAVCNDCGTNPPCGGTIRPATKANVHIFVRSDAALSGNELSFDKSSPHRIAVLERGKSAREQLTAWREDRGMLAAVYHVYEIKTAPSELDLVGKLIAIPVKPEPKVVK